MHPSFYKANAHCSKYDDEIPVINRSIAYLLDIKLYETSFTMVKWIKPPMLFVKLNTDGSCNNGACGGLGGVVRDDMGRFIMAIILPLGQGTSNWAEAYSFLLGLK